FQNISSILHYANTSPAFSAASFVITNLSCVNKSSTFTSSTVNTLTDFKLFAERITLSFLSVVTINAFSPALSASKRFTISFVLGASSEMSSNTNRSSSFTFDDKAERNAKRRTFLGSLQLQLRSVVAPNTTPPPSHCGERIDPCLARPVPFCRQGLRPPPRTSERFLTACVPCLKEARCIKTASCKT